jgi:hypothetical protein
VARLNAERNDHEETTADVYDHLTSIAKIGKEMLLLLGGINPTLSDSIMRFTIKFFKCLVFFTRAQSKFLNRCKVKMLPRTIASMVRFVQLVTSSQESLTQNLYQKLPNLASETDAAAADQQQQNQESSEDEDGNGGSKTKKKKKKKVTEVTKKKRAEREAQVKKRVAVRRSKTVPELIFQIEQWETELLKLTSLKYKNGLKVVDLGNAAKFNRISRNRDFKIDDAKMMEVSGSESEEDEEDEEDDGNGTANDEEEEEEDDGDDEDDDQDDEGDVKMGNTANDEEEEDSSDDDDEETQQLRSQSSAKRRRTEGQADL